MNRKVLHLLSQRPSFTGSGVSLEAVVRAAARIHVGERDEAVRLLEAVLEGLLGCVVVVLLFRGHQGEDHGLLDSAGVHEPEEPLHRHGRVAVERLPEVGMDVDYHLRRRPQMWQKQRRDS